MPDMTPSHHSTVSVAGHNVSHTGRLSSTCILDDRHPLAVRIRHCAIALLPKIKEKRRPSFESTQVTWYEQGGFYAPHTDIVFADRAASRRTWTFLLYLQEPEEGGDTVFYTDDREVHSVQQPKAGTMVVFDSGILHEARRVGRGKKIVAQLWVAM